MNKALTLLFVFFISFSFSQTGNCYNITYDSYSMTISTYKRPLENVMRLYVCGNKSLYQWEKVRMLDSIKNIREITSSDVSVFRTKERYAIEINNDSLVYYDVIANIEYQYSEKINFNWVLHSESKKINGYLCKKATVTYGGRNWEAWYAIDLPINAGPYKFKNLPGLIVELKDDTDSYIFKLKSLRTSNKLPLQKSFHDSDLDDVVLVKTTRNKYNKIRFKYNSMSLKERLNLVNKVQGTTTTLKITNSTLDDSFSSLRTSKSARKVNLIETDY